MISQALKRVVRATLDYPLETCLTTQQRFRLGRHILNRAAGENNGDPRCNGESLVRDQACRHLAGRPVIVFDIGANVGDWSLDISRRLTPGSTIYAFEPCGGTFERLCRRTAARPANIDIVPVRAGCGASQGHASLHVHGELAGSNSVFDRQTLHDARPATTEDIVVCQVDAFCRERGVAEIDVMKLDVEGAELDVLAGCRQQLARQAIGCIQFEYGGTWIDAKRFLMEAFSLLQPLGYTLGKIHPAGVRFQSRYEASHENFQYANWLAVREDWRAAFRD